MIIDENKYQQICECYVIQRLQKTRIRLQSLQNHTISSKGRKPVKLQFFTFVHEMNLILIPARGKFKAVEIVLHVHVEKRNNLEASYSLVIEMKLHPIARDTQYKIFVTLNICLNAEQFRMIFVLVRHLLSLVRSSREK